MFPSTAKLLLPAGQREKGQAAKPAAFQGYLCLYSKPLRQKREPKKVKDRLFLLIKAGQILGTPGSSFTSRHKILCCIWSFPEALG